MTEPDGERPSSANQLGFDLNRLPANVKTTLKVEPDESPEDARHRRRRENLILYFGLLIVTGAIAGSVYVAFGSTTASADDRKWAQSLLTLMIGAMIGYVIPKK
ncbi:MAG: hypothetical protein EOP37_19645 [Rubrivivax sp.]|nr:MAG: hypothetical protein EOP37_19645 [Rubrivivax sp.]